MVLKDNKYRVRSMISITGSLSFAKLLMMSFATPKSGGGGGGDARYASQFPFIHLLINQLSHKISTPKAMLLGVHSFYIKRNKSILGQKIKLNNNIYM